MTNRVIEAWQEEMKELDRMRESVQLASSQSFASMVHGEHVSSMGANHNGHLTPDHWITSIHIQLSFMNIDLSMHYVSKAARAVASKKLGIPVELLPNQLVIDVMQEYLNMLMGRLKSSFPHPGNQATIPLTRPAMDADGLGVIPIDRHSAEWSLVWQDHSFLFQAFIAQTGPIESHSEEEEKSSQNVEYL